MKKYIIKLESLVYSSTTDDDISVRVREKNTIWKNSLNS